MDTTELLKKVRKIEIKTRGLTRQVFSGEYHSAFKGRGMTFSEVKTYQYGDDVRNIDWNVTARFNEPFVKVYEEERELSVFFILDVSGSNDYGTGEKSKKELLLEITATLAFSAVMNNDKVGAILISDEVEKYIPPKKGRPNAMRILRELIYLQPKKSGTKLSAGIQFFNQIVKKRSISFVISDFNDENDFMDSLKIARRRHDMIALRLVDPAERELPKIGFAKMYDAEQGKTRWVNTSSQRVQKKFKEQAQQKDEQLQDKFHRFGIDYASLSTNSDYLKDLNKFFLLRSK